MKDKLPGKISVEMVTGDVAKLHGEDENKYALFQAASQFNCLEFPASHFTPEQGITGYSRDHTQGPACAIACGAGTLYRNYFVPVKLSNGDTQYGQTKENQLNTLSDVLEFIKNDTEKYFEVRNGYTMAEDSGLEKLNEKINKMGEEEKEQLRSHLKIGVHKNVQVTSTDWE
eukprot:TRINITY_DN4731_c0_g1_i1.p1 TRINITY_DN4731_c0_g1~~TRINITY_DN4731_c0_g1_i1.p1  ORF type:complete len:172 (-),score=23.04 TRINITY_DN4731_c0_g1_i1:99-614(-)